MSGSCRPGTSSQPWEVTEDVTQADLDNGVGTTEDTVPTHQHHGRHGRLCRRHCSHPGSHDEHREKENWFPESHTGSPAVGPRV